LPEDNVSEGPRNCVKIKDWRLYGNDARSAGFPSRWTL
jgi:hypothetical protein